MVEFYTRSLGYGATHASSVAPLINKCKVLYSKVWLSTLNTWPQTKCRVAACDFIADCLASDLQVSQQLCDAIKTNIS